MPVRAAEPGGDPPGGRQQLRPAAAADRSATVGAGSRRHGREAVGNAGCRDVGAAEGVDRLVGVADGDQEPAAAGEQLQQLLLRRVGVLVLVDEDLRRSGRRSAQQLRVAS